MTGSTNSVERHWRWVGLAVFLLALCAVGVLGLLAVSIMERRWESQRPSLVLVPIGKWETDNAKWGRNYPREYDTWRLAEADTSRTKFGGAYPRDYLDEDPMQVILFAGYGFSKDYRQARGHFHSIEDVLNTARTGPKTVATCWTCKSPDAPRLMQQVGVDAFYSSNFMALKDQMNNAIGCPDCHDPETMNLRISRPALREAFEMQGRDIDAATYQEMRSLVCAQCHVEYYFKNKYYLKFPWKRGTTVEQMLAYYDEIEFCDWVHPISKTPIIKAQHPDYELWRTGIHAYLGVACADCHMPYKSQGAVKFTDHQVRSPLLNIANSCQVCHRWGEQQIRSRVEAIQTKVQQAMLEAEDALVKAHFDIAAGVEAGLTDAELAAARKLLRHAQFRWDYVSASNGMGFHSPQESMRILGQAVNEAQQTRLVMARLLAGKGILTEPAYPDVSTREKAWNVASAFVKGQAVKLTR